MIVDIVEKKSVGSICIEEVIFNLNKIKKTIFSLLEPNKKYREKLSFPG